MLLASAQYRTDVNVSMDRIRIGHLAGYLRLLRIRLDMDINFEKNQIRTGYLFDFYNEISLRLIQDVPNDVSVFSLL